MLEVDTEWIAAATMGWLRFGKQFHYVAREAGQFAADVLGTNGKTVVEVEIKMSMSDFKADWKKNKHQHYKERAHVHTHTYPNGEKRRWQQHIPNQFYFAVPIGMKKSALEQINENQPEYGLITMDDNATHIPDFHLWKRLKVVKRAKFLHRKPPKEGLLMDMAARMSSDVCHIHFHRRMHKDWLTMAKDASDNYIASRDIENRERLKK